MSISVPSGATHPDAEVQEFSALAALRTAEPDSAQGDMNDTEERT